MGFFKKLFKSADPRKALRPDRLAKDSLAMGLDPAGSIVRAGRGKDMLSTNLKDNYDPGGFIAKTQRQPTNYAPYTPGVRAYKLSPAAQQLYQNIQARSAARAAGQQTPQPSTGMAAPPQVGMAPPQQLADGGRVRKNMEGCSHTENKAGKHKRNGKYR